jgi:hypothetical protein
MIGQRLLSGKLPVGVEISLPLGNASGSNSGAANETTPRGLAGMAEDGH